MKPSLLKALAALGLLQAMTSNALQVTSKERMTQIPIERSGVVLSESEHCVPCEEQVLSELPSDFAIDTTLAEAESAAALSRMASLSSGTSGSSYLNFNSFPDLKSA